MTPSGRCAWEHQGLAKLDQAVAWRPPDVRMDISAAGTSSSRTLCRSTCRPRPLRRHIGEQLTAAGAATLTSSRRRRPRRSAPRPRGGRPAHPSRLHRRPPAPRRRGPRSRRRERPPRSRRSRPSCGRTVPQISVSLMSRSPADIEPARTRTQPGACGGYPWRPPWPARREV
jgi:hypothetical protein